MLDTATLQRLLIWAIPLLFAITLHEVAHGWMACKLGDRTALMLGRLTLNPLKHIDLFGTVIVPLSLFFIGGFVFGWAKPVPVNTQVFKRPRLDIALVALAGPMANFLMAILWMLAHKIGAHYAASAPQALALASMGQAGVLINLVLAMINLLPIPPLDGGRICSSLLRGRVAYYYDQIEPYGFIILVVLIMTHLLSQIIGPPVAWFASLLLG